ncbi:MAG: beta strand repeat-containing protein [Gammaproteobacteria bacterium]
MDLFSPARASNVIDVTVGSVAVAPALTADSNVDTAALLARSYKGAVSITVSGAVSGGSTLGAVVLGQQDVTDVDLAVGSMNAGGHGAYVVNYGSGRTTFAATGAVTAGYAPNIQLSPANVFGVGIRNAATGNGVAVDVADVTAAKGIEATNNGSGALNVTASVLVTGTAGAAVKARGGALGNGVTLALAGTNSATHGVDVVHEGSGALRVSSSAPVTGVSGAGAYARNSAAGIGIVLDLAGASGTTNGIDVVNAGGGVVEIASTGPITGAAGAGIQATGQVGGSGLRIDVTDVAGATGGIQATSFGTGAVSVTASGHVQGAAQHGIYASNANLVGSNTATTAHDVTAQNVGVFALNYGTGTTAVTTTGIVTGTTNIGVLAKNRGSGLAVTNSGTVSGGAGGLVAAAYGSGNLTIQSSGAVDGGSGRGIYAFNQASGNNLVVDVADAAGATDAVDLRHAGGGVLTVTVSGAVTGGSGAGLRALTGTGRSSQVTVASGGVLGAASGLALVNDDGDAHVLIQAGGRVNGTLDLGGGNATVTNFGTLATLTGGSQQVQAGTAVFNAGLMDNAGTLTNNDFIANSGSLATAAGATFVNHGFLANNGTVSNAGTLNNDGQFTNNRAVTNSGALANSGQFVHGGTLVNDGSIANSGSFTIGGTASVSGSGSFTQSAGQLVVNGTMTQGTIVISGGTLGGSGTLNGTLAVEAGGLFAPGNSPGLMTIAGNLDLHAGAVTLLELGGLLPGAMVGGYDVIDVADDPGTGAVEGVATLAAGTVFDVDLYGGFTAALGDSFDVLVADTLVVNDFGSLVFDFARAGLGGGLAWQTGLVDLGGRDVLRLSVVAAPVPVPPALGLLGSALAWLGARRVRPSRDARRRG